MSRNRPRPSSLHPEACARLLLMFAELYCARAPYTVILAVFATTDAATRTFDGRIAVVLGYVPALSAASHSSPSANARDRGAISAAPYKLGTRWTSPSPGSRVVPRLRGVTVYSYNVGKS
jgi:hypothetical protein